MEGAFFHKVHILITICCPQFWQKSLEEPIPECTATSSLKGKSKMRNEAREMLINIFHSVLKGFDKNFVQSD